MERLRFKTYRARYPRRLVGKPLLIASSALCSLGDAIFGYSQGCISAALVQPSFLERMYGVRNLTLDMIAKGEIGVNEYLIGITVSCLNITALFAALSAASVCDTLGRRAAMRFGAFVTFVSAIIQVFAPNLAILITGRCLQGVAIGFLSMTVPIIQAEIAPGHARGVFITIENLFLNSGYSLSTWVGYAFYFYMPSEISWRGPYIVLTAIAAVLMAWSILLPETPRWLIKNGFHEEGLATLADLQGNGDVHDRGIVMTYREIAAAIELENMETERAPGWLQMFTRYTRRTVMAITSQMFAQLNGINGILYFLPVNLLRAGFDIPHSLLFTGACSTMLVAGIVPTMFLIDSWGRRPLLILGGISMILCLCTVGGLQFYVDHLKDGGPELANAAKGIFASICLYLASFAFSWGPVPWLLPAEVFPLHARARGVALATASNWLWNFIVALVSPPIFESLRGGTYFIIAGFVLTSVLLVIFIYRETAHKTLEELAEVFGEPAMADVASIIVPDATQARMSMHMSPRSRGMTMSRSRQFESGMGEMGVMPVHGRISMGSPVILTERDIARTITLERPSNSSGDDKMQSAMTSQATFTTGKAAP
ncbi:hypothetical protein CPB86DRAFT_713234 [Serendipita vermifera]|nr:hypothetical protein CPB86DRAFT_713234 [Serendipita vermifera]